MAKKMHKTDVAKSDKNIIHINPNDISVRDPFLIPACQLNGNHAVFQDKKRHPNRAQRKVAFRRELAACGYQKGERVVKVNTLSTKEGAGITNINQFYSEEWGEKGGYDCDLTINGKKVGFFHNAGEGGEPYVTFDKKEDEEKYNSLIAEYAKRRPEEITKNEKYKDYKLDYDVWCFVESMLTIKDAMECQKDSIKNNVFIICYDENQTHVLVGGKALTDVQLNACMKRDFAKFGDNYRIIRSREDFKAL